MLHRLDGPTIEHNDGCKEWFVEGKRHRVDGPAIERYERNSIYYEFWLDGEPVTPHVHEMNRNMCVPEND